MNLLHRHPVPFVSSAGQFIHRSLASGVLALLGAVATHAEAGFPEPQFKWDIELTSMDLNARNVLLPLGPGWSPMRVDLHIGESASLASKGLAFAFSGFPQQNPLAAATAPQPGDSFFVQSFFDVFFDFKVTDVDPTLNFGGGPTDGLSLLYPNNGPAHMQNFYSALFDPNAPNFGLIPPPEAAPSIGWFNIEILLGADFNGNGENDKIKFTLAALTAQEENRTFITLPDGTVINSYDSILDLSGAVLDESQDPPFGPITLTGPTTTTARLVPVIPETAPTGAAWMLGLLGTTVWLRQRRSQR